MRTDDRKASAESAGYRSISYLWRKHQGRREWRFLLSCKTSELTSVRDTYTVRGDPLVSSRVAQRRMIIQATSVVAARAFLSFVVRDCWIVLVQVAEHVCQNGLEQVDLILRIALTASQIEFEVTRAGGLGITPRRHEVAHRRESRHHGGQARARGTLRSVMLLNVLVSLPDTSSEQEHPVRRMATDLRHAISSISLKTPVWMRITRLNIDGRKPCQRSVSGLVCQAHCRRVHVYEYYPSTYGKNLTDPPRFMQHDDPPNSDNDGDNDAARRVVIESYGAVRSGRFQHTIPPLGFCNLRIEQLWSALLQYGCWLRSAVHRTHVPECGD
nr:hypothetical protein CFP56_24530 [Quercus suber]